MVAVNSTIHYFSACLFVCLFVSALLISFVDTDFPQANTFFFFFLLLKFRLRLRLRLRLRFRPQARLLAPNPWLFDPKHRPRPLLQSAQRPDGRRKLAILRQDSRLKARNRKWAMKGKERARRHGALRIGKKSTHDSTHGQPCYRPKYEVLLFSLSLSKIFKKSYCESIRKANRSSLTLIHPPTRLPPPKKSE